jgi:tetratricopeptide (TPR) repeat protein
VRNGAEWLLLFAMVNWHLGDFGRSRAAALEARDRYRAFGDVDGEMRSENGAAAGAFALGDLAEADRGFSRALMLADSLSDNIMEARCSNNLGNVAYYLGQYETALSFYRLALAGFEKLSSWRGLAEAWLNTAIAWREHGDLRAARSAADHALEAAERSGDRRLFGQALAASAETHLAQGDTAHARAQAEVAVGIARAKQDALGEADALRILSLTARHDGEYALGEELCLEALDVARRVDHPWAIAEVQRALAELHAAAGRSEVARQTFHEAAQAFERLGAVSRADADRECPSYLPTQEPLLGPIVKGVTFSPVDASDIQAAHRHYPSGSIAVSRAHVLREGSVPMRIHTMFGLLTGALLVGCGGAADDARDVAQSFWEASRDGDVERARSYVSESSAAKINEQDDESGVGEVAIGEARIEEGVALVETTISGMDEDMPMGVEFETVLVREEGAWKVDLDRTTGNMMKSMLGVSLNAVAEEMGKALGEAMGQMVEGMQEGFESMADSLADTNRNR